MKFGRPRCCKKARIRTYDPCLLNRLRLFHTNHLNLVGHAVVKKRGFEPMTPAYLTV
jgi:hypothetical protein